MLTRNTVRPGRSYTIPYPAQGRMLTALVQVDEVWVDEGNVVRYKAHWVSRPLCAETLTGERNTQFQGVAR